MPAESRRRQRSVLYWAPHEEQAWVPCSVKSEDEDKATLVVEGSPEEEELVFRKARLNDFHLVLPQHEVGVDDVCSLPSVPEGALLHTVRVRYGRNEIYTRVARTVIAVNPFCSLPIYSSQCVDQYMEAVDSMDLPPHIFGLSKDALEGVRTNSCNQAVLISGESGAGKTESAKLILSFVTDAVRDAQTQGPGITEKVLQTNPVLEAFGNAMTVRNNNSSRFGKWLDLAFSGVGATEITGCRLMSYLLETTRVCAQASDERGFHIFFQLLQARNSPHCAGLDLKDPSHYRYIKGGQRAAPGIDDGQCFEEVCEALATVGFGAEARTEIFGVVAGVLLLGNCEFEKGSPEQAKLIDEEPAKGAAKHFGVDVDALKDCILVRKLHVGNDVTRAPLRLEQAQAARDALARLLYGRLFLHLIAEMNATLTVDRGEIGGSERCLGVLDIAGFESFETNSLEQLMINLSNEQLQQHFNSVVIKDELKECEKENVPVPDGLKFADNADSVALIDGKGGILDVLDETMGMPGASNQSFVTYVLKQHKDHQRVITSKIARLGFGISHYAGDVMYSCDGWLEKNANNPPDAAVEMLASSSKACLQKIHQALKQELDEASAKGAVGRTTVRATAKAKTKSATMLFRVSLRSLAAKIEAAQSHFMRCVKPNKEKVPGRLVGRMVMEQLLLSGVLATVHIRQKGYAHRIPMLTFYSEYRCVGSRPVKYFKEGQEQQVRTEVEALLKEVGGGQFPTGAFAMGKTKVFGKSEAVRALDNARREAEGRKAVVLQRHVRGRAARKRARALNEVRADIREFLRSRRLDAEASQPQQAGRAGLARSRTRRLSMWFGGSTLAQLGSAQALKDSIAELDRLVAKAASVGLENADVLSAERAKLRMRREDEAWTALEDPELRKSVDPVTLDKVLARARGLALPRWGTLELLEDRIERLHAQLPIVQALRVALAHDGADQTGTGGQEAAEGIERVEALSHLYEVAQEVEEAGLNDEDQWLPELEGAELSAEVARRIAKAEAAATAAEEAAEAAAEAERRAAAGAEAARAEAAAEALAAAASEAAAAAGTGGEGPAAPEEATTAAAAEAAAAPGAERAPKAQRQAVLAPWKNAASKLGKQRLAFARANAREAEKLRGTLQKAADEYDAEALEALLRQAEKAGVREEQCEPLADARRAFENLQVVDFVVASLEMAEREAKQPDVPLAALRRLENLARQLGGMAGHEGEISEANEILQAALVERHKAAGKKSILESQDPEEVILGNSAFSALSKFSGLKSTKAWLGHRPSVRTDTRTPVPRSELGGDGMLRYSKVCIAGALTRAPHGLDEEEYEAGAVQNFRNILVYMGDRPASACQRQASRDAVLAVARLEPALRSEVYLQVLKQVSGNPNPRSARLGWDLLHCLCLDAPPAVEVVEFVRTAFRDAAADPESEAASMAGACRALLDRPEVKLKVLGASPPDQLSLEGAQHLSSVDMERARQAAEIAQLKEEMARLRGASGRKGNGFWAQFCFRCG